MDNMIFMEKAKDAVVQWYKENKGRTLDIEKVYIVWFCKTLQNWKAMLSTEIPDTRYFEATYNGDKTEIYLDAYLKENNTVYRDLMEEN